MKYAVVASTWASVSRTLAAVAIGSWVALAICPTVFAADGAQAAAAAKEVAANFKAYLRDLEKSKALPDYSKPPASEYLKRIFDADALAALPAPKPDDIGWLFHWVESANVSYKALTMFGLEKGGDIIQAAARNMSRYENEITAATAFVLRLGARTASTAEIRFNSLPSEQRNEVRRDGLEKTRRGLVQTAFGTSMTMSSGLKPQNAGS